MAAYISLLQRWGRSLNLTAASRMSPPALWDLIDGCLCIVPYLPQSLDRLVDLGSGQGFPAIPLAIETGVQIDLIEADRRKAAFLVSAMAELGLAGRVYPTRIEVTKLQPARCVTARALAPVGKLIRLARPFLSPDGIALFLKGPAAVSEIEALDQSEAASVELLPTNRPPATLVRVFPLG